MTASRIATALEQADIDSNLNAWIGGGDCQGSKFHSPRPLLVRPYHLSTLVVEAQGQEPGSRSDLAHLCATCFDNVTVYVSLLIAYDGAPPPGLRRDFGNVIRELGHRAWEHRFNRSDAAPV